MKSPIKDKNLRNPGQSLDLYLRDIALNDGVKYIIYGTMVFLAALLNWIFYFLEKPPNPWVVTVLATIFILYCYYKVKQAEKKIERVKQGRDGEKAVGQYLERLRSQGAQVFHDIPAKGFNLDHVVIAKSGVYVIETKTFSKPDKGKAKIIYTGEQLIHKNGVKDNKPLIQVKAASNWLKELMKESTGRSIKIKKVIVFPGWFVEPTAEAKQSEIWVLNPKALPTFISNSAEQLTDEDVNLVSFHLSRYIRSYAE